MASGIPEAPGRGSAEFVESSVLEVVVPVDSAIDIEEELGAWDGRVEDENAPILPFISQRQLLLFDEIVPLYVVLRTPFIEEDTLKVYLKRLSINLEAFVFSTAPPPEPETKAPPPKEVIYSETIKDSTIPIIVRLGEEANSHVYVLWKLPVFICRPRGRFHKPAIYFQPTASLKPVEKPKKHAIDDEYLPSRVPTALNLLQSFDDDPALAGVHPRLSALRISKIAPTNPVARELVRPVRTGQRRLFRALPALIWRMRYSKSGGALSDVSLIASLDLEVAHVTGCSVIVEDIDVTLEDGSVQPISTHITGSTVHKPGDQITHLYTIRPDPVAEKRLATGSDGHILLLKIKAKVLLSKGCRPDINIEWKTAVDFTAQHNPLHVTTAKRLSNPALQQSKIPNPDALPVEEGQSQQGDAASKPLDVILTISGPPLVHVGGVFYWDVFIVNRSEKSRKLAVLILPKRRRDLERQRSQPSTSSSGEQPVDKKDLIARAVVDENVVYAKQKNARTEVGDLICLTTDVRIGHLAPGACYTAGLKFLALSTGVLAVDAVRVVDLATQEAADIRDLPSVVAIEQEE